MGKGTGTCTERVSLQLSEAKPPANEESQQLDTSNNSEGALYAERDNTPSEISHSTEPSNQSKAAIERPDRDKQWHNKKGQLHRVNGPAVEWSTGDKEWWVNGKRHREDGPAVEFARGNKQWYENGKLHRKDGPAVEWADGDKQWYRNGKRHRVNGPAVEWANGAKSWYLNGKRHRENGPAVEYANGDKEWWSHGKEQL